MAILSGLAGILGRFAGRLLNSTLGWATILLFGKVSGRKQTILLVVALASLLEVLLIVGIVFPDVGAFLIAFVPLPSFVDKNVVRLVMLVLALALPIAVGVAGLFMTEASARPKGGAIVTSVLRGYPLTIVIAATIAFLAVVAIVRKVQSLARRWEDAHVAVIVKPGGYDEVVRGLDRVLRQAGIAVQPRPAAAILSVPPRLLAKVAGGGLGSLVPDRLVTLRAPDLEALVYPSDISIGGPKERVALARAVIASKLTDVPAYLTASAEAEKIEDELKEVRGLPDGAARARLGAVDQQLLELIVPYEEWETVYRERLQVERDLLEGDAIQSATRSASRAGQMRAADEGRASMPEMAFAVGAVALVACDLALLLADRLGGRRTR